MSELHVAITAHFWGQASTGSGQYLHKLVETLRAHHPALRLTLIADAAAAARAAAPDGVGWQVGRTPFDGRNANLAKVWFEQIVAPRLAAEAGAHLLHVPYFAPPLRSALPTVVTIHDLIPMLLPPYRGSALVRGYTALAAHAARHSAHILADSNASRRDILRALRVEPRGVSTVYLAADEGFRPQPAAAIAAIRAKLALPERFVLYLGGFDVRKNVPLLLEALAQCGGEWPLVIAGKLPTQDSAFTPDPRRVARELGIEERVRFVGWVEEADKAPLLGAASLFVFPSAYEGFGLPILEAMGCGTATLSTNVSSLPELAGDAAVLVPPNEVGALAAAMARLMENDAARQELAGARPRAGRALLVGALRQRDRRDLSGGGGGVARMAVTVRPLQADDHRHVLDVARSLAAWFQPLDQMALAIDLDEHEGLVALQAGQLVAFLTFYLIDATVAELSWLGVSPEVQARGIGGALLDALEATLRARAVQQLQLNTVPADFNAAFAPTNNFYRHHGFTLAHRIENFYAHGRPGITFVKQLDDKG